MQYRYTQNRNFEDYSSGRVFYARPGHPAFPVRLASEIFQRALAHWEAAGGCAPCTIYDPVCGGAYWLTVLAYLHWDSISAIYASDLDRDMLLIAERNLSLTTSSGLNKRLAEINKMLAAYQKKSHEEALESAKKFNQQLEINLKMHAIKTLVFQADATNPKSLKHGLGELQVDLVLADVPYGWHSEWKVRDSESGGKQSSVELMLETMQYFLKPGTVVAVAADKRQKVKHPMYKRLERFQLGKRRIFIFSREVAK